ncbi:MAG: enoyl-CoA hydratase-related protein [Syntrophales bacterium]|nr:enoyl-CoA hydratase-related protein [Syntrophales bacterium]
MGREFISYEMEKATAIIVINRPPVNALNTDLMNELGDVFEEIGRKADVRAVILTGAGGRVFVAGADVNEILGYGREGGEDFSLRGQKIINKIANFNRPVICAVNGLALGGGCELAMACDIRIMSEKASIGQPESGLGVIPGAGGTQRLPRLVSRGMAKLLLFTGDSISAQEALRIGLVEKVVPADQVLDAAKEVADKIANKGPEAIRLIKHAINEGLDMPLSDALNLERRLFGEVCGTEDKNEGIRAFLEKRAPKYQGK